MDTLSSYEQLLADRREQRRVENPLLRAKTAPPVNGQLLCFTCEEWLPVEAFGKPRTSKRGYLLHCLGCFAAQARARRVANPGHQAKNQRARNQRTKAIPLAERTIPKAKRCTACGELKKIAAFNVLLRNSDGHHGQCRDCVQRSLGSTPMQQPLYWLAGQAGIEPGAFCTACQRVVPLAECRPDPRGYRRRMQRCLACRTIKRMVWREENFARDMENQRLWREAHPEFLHIYQQTRYDKIMADPDLKAIQYAAVAAREIGKGTLTRAEWEDIKATHNYACVYCGRTDMPLTKDHIIPVIDGGKLVKGNVVPACKSCNSKKGPMSYDEFMAKISS